VSELKTLEQRKKKKEEIEYQPASQLVQLADPVAL
jgi:hypothetical protein